ncbi:MAG: undecaprenyl-diphosphatase UppP [Chitinophagales bacterium]|nr:undecaprenyl-diphosphatase UppP [Chitinophagales bacterium]
MNEIIIALILGIVQGLTEFLPVSSSGHLELAKYFLGDHATAHESLLMTVVVHFGTALSTMYVFRKEIFEILQSLLSKGQSENKSFAYKIILSMIPAVLVGLLFEKQIEQMFTQNIMIVCAMLIITGILLYVSDKAKNTTRNVTYSDAIWVGIAQAIAIIPGISRSGSTIATSVLLGIDRTKAARFSFLMVVPLIFGKIAKDLIDGNLTSSTIPAIELFVGFLAAFVTGIFACSWMIQLVRNSNLRYFGLYCLIIGLAGIVYASLT